MNNKIIKYHMFNEQLSQQLSQSILDNQMSFEHLVSFLNHYPAIKSFLNNGTFKIPLIFNDSPLGNLVATSKQVEDILNNKFLSKNQEKVLIEIPCIHYLFLKFKEHSKTLSEIFDIQPFNLSFLHKGDKKYLLLGFNLYNLLNLKIEEKNYSQFPLTLNSKEEFFNYYYEKKSNNNYTSSYCDSLFPLFNFKINIEDLLYDNNNFTLEGRHVVVHLLGNKIEAYFKNLDELNHHERVPLDALIQYKIKNQQINFDFNASSFFDLLIMKNYFIKSSVHYNFCLMLLEKTPDIFTHEIMALICLKNRELHELLLKNFPTNYFPMHNQSYESNANSNINKESIMNNYNSLIEELQSIVEPLIITDLQVNTAWYQLKVHLNTINQDNGISFLSENIEEKITFENMITKYIPSILNNYLSIPVHLRNKENSTFIKMTLNQFESLEKELEKIELAILQEDIKKMKVFGKFLDDRLQNNTVDIIKIN